MVEQYQSIGTPNLIPAQPGYQGPAKTNKPVGGEDFKSMLMRSIEEVNRLQNEAEHARINLATGQTDKVSEVITAVKKAELAFQTLMQIRNQLMDAYEEIKQMRV